MFTFCSYAGYHLGNQMAYNFVRQNQSTLIKQILFDFMHFYNLESFGLEEQYILHLHVFWNESAKNGQNISHDEV